MSGDNADRKTLIDRADQMILQSRTLQLMSDVLRRESKTLKNKSADLRRLIPRTQPRKKR
jgi:hypothetical protein